MNDNSPDPNHTIKRFSKVTLNNLEAGSYLGEFSVIDKQETSASVIALTECKLLKLNSHNFETILNSNDRISKTIYKNLLLMAIDKIRKKDKELDVMFL